jgi:5-methyltetrahydrofolate--homocysteine methyltransferase
MESLLEALTFKPLLCDGAMGTQLQAAGLKPGECGDAWNLEYPEKVLAIQKAYTLAGSDCITTNTFGACRLSLAHRGYGDQVAEINRAAVRIARDALDDKEGFVLGDIGPFGGLLEPYGTVKAEDVRRAFDEQAKALIEEGADAIIIETQTDLAELGLAIDAALEAGALCVISSMAFDVTRDGTDARTMMGITPEQAAEFIQSRGAHVVSTNCGTGVDAVWAAKILRRYRSVCDLPVMAQPNLGKPEVRGSEAVYQETPEDIAGGLDELLGAGARIVGACCGSTPEHIRWLRQQLDGKLMKKT